MVGCEQLEAITAPHSSNLLIGLDFEINYHEEDPTKKLQTG